MSEDHLDPDIHLWPEECSSCEELEVRIEQLEAELERLEEAAKAVVDTSHKDGSGFWGGDYRKLDALAALLGG
jgi:hypothetical protein